MMPAGGQIVSRWSSTRKVRWDGVRLQGEGSRRPGDRIDPAVVSLVAELRGHERQPAEGLPAATMLAMLLTDEEPEKRARVGENREARTTQVDQMSRALNRLRAMVSLPTYSPPMACPRRATADGGR
jgi:hypothetical protein